MNIKLKANQYFNLIKKEIFDEKGIFIRLINKSIKRLYFRKIILYILFLAYPLFFSLLREISLEEIRIFTKKSSKSLIE